MFYHQIDQIKCDALRFVSLCYCYGLFLFFPSDAVCAPSAAAATYFRVKKEKEKSRFSIKFETFAMKAIAILLLQKREEKNREIKFIESKE